MTSADKGDGDRWLRVLWLAAIRDAGGRGLWLLQSTCVSAPSCSTREVEWCMSGTCTLRIIGSPAGDRVTASLNSRLLLYCVVSPIVL